MSGRVTRGTLVIDADKCKGCELCIAACPPQVLSMSAAVNEPGYRFPILHDGCTGCTACQVVCPDYVISVYRFSRASSDSFPAQSPDPLSGESPGSVARASSDHGDDDRVAG